MREASPAPASGPPPPASLWVHVSTAEIGGAEASLLEALARRPGRPFFLVPGEGPLTRALDSRGWGWKAVPWPAGMRLVTQRNLLALPLVIPGLPAYLLRLWLLLRRAPEVLSSGFKSHAACLPLSPLLGPRLRFDVRDFLKPARARRLIAAAVRRFGCRVTANSAAVAADYPGAEVEYPAVRLSRPASPRAPGESRAGRRIITHLAYFAPYKGQDLFLTLARRLLDKGLDAEFWLAGDVIYPAAAYARYREDVMALAARLGLASRVRFLGRVQGAAAVQDVLESTDLLLHCTREPEPFGRSVLEALLCGCEAVCHKGSGVCEVTASTRIFPGWMEPLGRVLGEEFVRVSLKTPP